jgi:chromosomal replication initiator protein
MRSAAPASTPRDAAPDWLAGLIAFNEELRALFVGRPKGDPLIVARHVRDAVAAHFGITVAEIVGGRTTRQCARPRQIAMYICVRQTGLSAPRVARLFGDRDHTTVLHAARRIKARMAEDPAFAAEVAALIEQCRAGVLA